MARGAVVTIVRAGMAMSLDDDGDRVQVLNPTGLVVHEIQYPPAQVGEVISPP